METTERTIDHGEPPFQAWSEEIPDFICSVCEKDGEIYEAVTYCTICCEFMCTRSLKDHNKFSPNKSHRLLGKSEMRAQGKSLTLSIRHGSDDISNSLSHSIRHGSDTMDVSLSQSILRGSDAMASIFSDSSQQGIDAVSNSYEQYQELERRLEECQDELRQKKTELDNQRREYEYSTQRCADLIVDMTDMKTCKDDLQKKLEQSQDRADTQGKEDKERYDKLESEHKEIKHRLHALSTELDIQCRVNDSLKRKQDLAEKQCVELEQKVKELTSHERQLQTYLKDEKDGRVKINDRLNEVKSDLEQKETEIKSLLKDIEKMKQLKQDTDVHHAELIVQLDDQKKKNLQLEKTIKENTKECKTLKEKFTESETRLSEMEILNIQTSPSPHQRQQQQPTPFVKVIRKVDTEDICLQRFTTHTRTSPAKYCSTSPVQYKQFQSFDKTLSRYQEKHEEPCIISVSIFFGAITSRCTLSINSDVFHVMSPIWRSVNGLYIKNKALSFALIQPDGETLHSFGYDALEKYEELKEEGICNDWYFFKGFDPLLFSQSDTRSTSMVEDINGRKYPLGRVISLCITFLHDHILEKINSMVAKTIHFSDVRWVFVIPDICSTATAQIIVTAAETCLHGSMVRINEAEATLFSCDSRPSKLYVMEKREHDENENHSKSEYNTLYVNKLEFSMEESEIGTKYIVLNLEEELAICTVHEIMRGHVIRRTGTGYVMLDIDNVVKKFWENICGPEVMQSFKEDHPDEYTDLTLTLRERLMYLACTGGERISISYDIRLEVLLFEKEGKTFKQAVEESIYAGQINVRRRGLIRMEKHVFVEILQTYYNNLADIALDFVRHEAVQDDSAIVMTGEQFNFDMMVKIMRKKFARARIYFDEYYSETGPALYGHVSIR